MNEKEKKAIEIIKDEIDRYKAIETPKEVYITDIKMLLNLIDKQQKEIKELKQENYIQVYQQAIANYKDKIKEIIDICDNTHEQYVELPNGKVIDRNYCGYLIEYLKELLEEE